MFSFLQAFISDRTLKVKIGGAYSSPKPQEQGVPQGSVISPTLFLVSINGIVQAVAEADTSLQCSLFADDFLLYFSSINLFTAITRTQSGVNAATSWASRRGCRFSSSKTVAMHFCKSQQRPRQKVPPHIILGGIPIPYEQSTKFLGVIFDQNLTWNNHILNLRQSSLSALNILKTVSGRDWGADQPSLLRLYHALIRSRLDYACQIYSSASATSLRSLDTVHHQALRLCTGAYRTSPVESLYVLSGDLPLSNRREQLLLSFYFKCKSFRKIPSFDVVNNVRLRDTYNTKRSASVPAHIRALRLLEEGNDCPLKVSESRNFDTPPWCKPIPEFCPMEQSKSGHLPYIVAASFEEHKESHADSIAVYTDGSKSPAGVGCAAVTSSQTFTAKLPFTSSVFTAELYAILLALKHFILNSDFNDFTIYSDSQSSILALTNFIPSHPVISEIQEWLTRTAAREKTVRFCWSPGHVGIIGNEKADRAAKSAVARPLPSRGDSPFSDIRTTISSRVRRKETQYLARRTFEEAESERQITYTLRIKNVRTWWLVEHQPASFQENPRKRKRTLAFDGEDNEGSTAKRRRVESPTSVSSQTRSHTLLDDGVHDSVNSLSKFICTSVPEITSHEATNAPEIMDQSGTERVVQL
ncbi:uncharacterized protein LOC143028964 [Oratosquilla oratoria]|uniref:uncharacterized protein LOC143028964 n=1 Tax=Oratosquilla oratoria TaxID=337810 RepID=UPI003F776D18